jgi:hypothetical protein
LSDGESLVVYQDRSGFNPLHWQRRSPPHAEQVLVNDEVKLSLFGAQEYVSGGALGGDRAAGGA